MAQSGRGAQGWSSGTASLMLFPLFVGAQARGISRVAMGADNSQAGVPD